MVWRFTVIVSLLGMHLPARADDFRDSLVAAMFSEGESQRESLVQQAMLRLDQAKQDLDLAKQGKYERKNLPAGIYTENVLFAEFQSDVERKKAIAAWESQCVAISKQIADLKNKKLPVVPEIRNFLESGKAGALPLGSVIKERIDDSSALILVRLPRTRPEIGSSDPRDVLAYLDNFDFAKADVVDGRLKLPGVFLVTGTKVGKGGKGTEEFVLEPFDVARDIRAEQERLSLPKALIPVKPQKKSTKATPRGK
jgi:hypothetical protein